MFIGRGCVDESVTWLLLSLHRMHGTGCNTAEATAVDRYFLLPTENTFVPVCLGYWNTD